jgi:hypothetical protein
MITVYQGRNTRKTVVKIQNTAEKGTETQNTIGGDSMPQRRRALKEPYPTARRGRR